MERFETAALIEACRICGGPILSSEPLILEDNGDRSTHPLCSSCHSDLADPVEEWLYSDLTSFDSISMKIGVAEKRH